jgi:hypothetical protein
MGKNFRALFHFMKKFKFWNFKKKSLTIVFRTTSGKKFCKIKFTKEESDTIMSAASIRGESLEQFFDSLLKELIESEKRKTHLPKVQR